MDKGSYYHDQVAYLVQVLPYVAAHKCFALKGGTAINLFVRDLPRLSVDIDLVYLPVNARDEALAEVKGNLDQLEKTLVRELRGTQIQRPPHQESDSQRLTLRRGQLQIKVELSPVLRGTVWPPEMRDVSPRVEAEFGFASTNVVSLNDLYAGKICAALDRQHPRDLFDVKLLLENEGISRDMFRTFLVYLISHGRPISELISPTRKDIAALYEGEFLSMARDRVSLEELLDVREKMIATLHQALTDQDKAFLLSMKRREPDWSLLGIEGVADLPAVKWKILNLGRMAPAKHEAAYNRLQQVLESL